MALRFQQVGFAVIVLLLTATFTSSATAAPREEHEALKQLSGQPPATIVRGSKEYHEWTRARSKTLHESGLKFIADYPEDPLRWDVLVLLRYSISGNNQDAPAADVWAYLGKLDPRFGDAAQYRDKIVLVVYDSVDAANIRRLESLHRLYNSAGLEIIQIAYFSRDKAASPPRRDRMAMERYVAEKQWPWPVLWEHAKNLQGDFHFYWGENAIPATLLIGRDGRLVRDVPGERDWDTRVQRALFGSVTKSR